MNSRWNTTEAYDLSLYEIPAEPVRKPQPAPALRKKAKTQKALWLFAKDGPELGTKLSEQAERFL